MKRLLAPERLPQGYVRRLSPDEAGGFVATVHEFPGCIGHGPTSESALASLDASAQAWINATLASGKPLPEPANYDECSGKIALRISRRLHCQAAERAAIEGTSLNQLIAVALASYLAGKEAGGDVARSIDAAIVAFSQELRSMNTKLNACRATEGNVQFNRVGHGANLPIAKKASRSPTP